MNLPAPPPPVQMGDPPSLYRVPPERLAKVRHDCANALTAACGRGHAATARQYARIVAQVDDILDAPQRRTADGWRRLIADLIGGAR
jgi:hypothetical protein